MSACRSVLSPQWLVVALALTCAPQETPKPAPPTQPAAATPAAADLAQLRRARIDREAAALETELHAIDAFGHADEFAAALDQALEHPAAMKWCTVNDHWFPLVTLERYVLWSRPLKERTQPLALDFEQPNHPFDAALDLSNQLHEHDVECLVVVFPSRAQLYPELVLPELADAVAKPGAFHGMVAATTRFLLALAKAGVEVVDLAPPFVVERRAADVSEGASRELYLQRNHHWTPRAAELAARIVAARVREEPWFKPGPVVEGKEFEIVPRHFPFESNADGAVPGSPPELIDVHSVREKGKPESPVARRASPIVVLTDSFGDFFDEMGGSFIAQLRRFTGWPIDAIAINGGAEGECRDAFSRRRDKLRGKQVVIWLLQEANLRPAAAFRKYDLFNR